MLVTFRNEFLQATIGDRTLALAPDLICILDRETGEPITTENLGYGQRAKVVAIAATDNMRDEAALQVIGPRVFGVDQDFQKFETLAWS